MNNKAESTIESPSTGEVLQLKKFVRIMLGLYALIGVVLVMIGVIAGSLLTFIFVK